MVSMCLSEVHQHRPHCPEICQDYHGEVPTFQRRSLHTFPPLKDDLGRALKVSVEDRDLSKIN